MEDFEAINNISVKSYYFGKMKFITYTAAKSDLFKISNTIFQLERRKLLGPEIIICCLELSYKNLTPQVEGVFISLLASTKTTLLDQSLGDLCLYMLIERVFTFF